MQHKNSQFSSNPLKLPQMSAHNASSTINSDLDSDHTDDGGRPMGYDTRNQTKQLHCVVNPITLPRPPSTGNVGVLHANSCAASGNGGMSHPHSHAASDNGGMSHLHSHEGPDSGGVSHLQAHTSSVLALPQFKKSLTTSMTPQKMDK
ncbi:hypothetical protein BS17DRAFT_814991 [Gyrodon lividus]|nr:hypothetical protein BS17DRAFT_814991 [Gyrodon lividus]